jgi:RNA polymerase sigma-70 factor (ECF subfamily)
LSDGAEAALAATFRDEWPRLVAAALRIAGDLQTAEDAAQDSFLAALDKWALAGVPERPGAWLMAVCRNRARNAVRDAGRADKKAQSLRPLLAGQPSADGGQPGIADDRLRLIAMCCHPLLSMNAQVALTLRMVAGLTTEEIARSFHAPIPTVAQRIARAKRVLAENRVTFTNDDPVVLGRLPAILDVIYLIFNEGYLAAAGSALTRGDLAFEGYRLCCLLTELAPGEAAPWALRALVCFQLSRWNTRTGEGGELLTLDAQDRSQWDRALTADGAGALTRARRGGRGPLLLQAELAACHATAPSSDATDWAAIVALYDELLAIEDSPVVALNRAVAIAMARGPATALPLLDDLASDPALARSHRVWAVRADLHRRLGHTRAALDDYQRALELVRNDVERRYLTNARARLTARY